MSVKKYYSFGLKISVIQILKKLLKHTISTKKRLNYPSSFFINSLSYLKNYHFYSFILYLLPKKLLVIHIEKV